MVAKEQVFMALFLFVIGGWALYAGIWGPHPDPRYQPRKSRQVSFSVLLANLSPTIERLFSKGVVVLGGLGLVAMGVYVLVHKW